jgi:ABC-type glycerol-3-phosphate transport system substrate-binding protein
MRGEIDRPRVRTGPGLTRRAALRAGGAGVVSLYLIGCGGDDGDAGAGATEVSVTYDFGYAGEPGSMQKYWQTLQRQLQDGSEGVRIKDLAFVDERSLLPRLQSQHTAKRGPVLETYFTGWNTYIFLNQGVLEPLDEYVGDGEPENWIGARPVDGKFYVAPFLADSAVLFVNRALARKAGVELGDVTKGERFESWDEFATALRKVKRSGITPVAMGAADGLAQDKWTQATELEFLQSRAEIPRIATGDTPVSEPVASGWADHLEELRADGLLNDKAAEITEQQSIASFLKGEQAFIMTFPGAILKADNADDFEILGYWKGDSPYNTALAVAGSGLMMTNYGENKEAAGKLIDYMHKPEQLTLFNEVTGELPADKRFNASGLSPLTVKLLGLIKEPPPGSAPATWVHDEVSGTQLVAIWDTARSVLAGKSADEARSDLETRLEKYRSQNKAEVRVMERYADILAEE